MDFNGIITDVSPVMQGVSAKGNPWAKQICVIETNDTSRQRQDSLAFEVFGADKINAFGLRKGDQVTVQLNFEGSIGQYQSKKDGTVQYVTRTNPSAWGILRGGVPVRVQREVAAPAPTAFGAMPQAQVAAPVQQPQQPFGQQYPQQVVVQPQYPQPQQNLQQTPFGDPFASNDGTAAF